MANGEPATVQGRRYDCMGLPLTCGNDEALGWYNKAIVGYFTLREDPIPPADKACELDDTLLLAHCFLANIWFSDLKPPTDYRVAPHLEAVKSVDVDKITDREKAHIRATLAYASGNLPQATEEWAAILVEYPHDISGIHHLFDACIILGMYPKQRDFLARLLPLWDESMPFYPSVIAEYAFSLEENNQRDKAEELARKALSMEARAPWATHALGHVIEEERDAEQGVEFLTSTRKNWHDCGLGGHIAWHLTLYYLDLGKIDEVLHEFDTVLYDRATGESPFGLLDAASLLWRLNVMGVDPGEKRWARVTEGCTKLIGNHRSAWFDMHIVMSITHGKISESAARMALANQMMKSLGEYSKSGVSTNCDIAEKLGVPVCNALLAFGQEKYDEVVSIMLPLRYDLVRFGGSYAQRQVFSVTLIEAAIRDKQIPLALAFVAELKAQKPKNKTLAKMFEELKELFDKQKALESEQPAVKRIRVS